MSEVRRSPRADFSHFYNRRSRRPVEALEPRRLLAAIASGQTLGATIGALGEFDDYTFTVNAGEVIHAAVSRNASAIEPRLRIVAPSNTVVVDAANTFGLERSITAAETGTYTIRVSDSGDDETGGYNVSMVRVPGAQASDGDDGPFTSGQSYLGSFALGDLDVYTFNASAGESVTIGFSRVNSSVQPFLTVYSPTGAVVYNQSATFALAADVALTESGTYYALARDVATDEAGGYRISFARPLTPTVATPLGNGAWVRSGVELGQFKLYTFNVTQPGAGVRMGLSRYSSVIDPRMTVYNPAGQQVATGVDTFGFNLDFTAAIPGTYVAVVGDAAADEAGDFGLTVAVGGAAPALDRGPLVSGRQVRSNLEYGELEVFSFTGAADETVIFGMSRANSAIDPRIDIYGPNGVKVASGVDTFGFNIELTLPATGTYLAVASDSASDEIGAYHMSFARSTGAQSVGPLNGDAEGGTINSGHRAAGFLDVGDLDVYTFSADAGDNLLIGMSRINSAIDPRFNLYRPDGQLLTAQQGTFSAGAAVVAPIGGTYVLVARDVGSDEVGYYAVSLAIGPHAFVNDPDDADGGTLTSGQTLAGYLTSADSDIFTFTATAGAGFSVQMARQNASAIEPALEVYAPDGTRYANTGAFSAAINVASAPASGTYIVVAADGAFDEPGGYVVSLDTTPNTVDTRAPTALLGQLEYLRSGNVQVQFSEAMTGLVATSLTLNNVTTGGNFVGTSVTFDSATGLATYVVTGGLPDGNYNASLAVGTARDLSNNALAAPLNFSFFVLRGDANRDRSVNIADFSIVAANYNQLGTFGEGDFNYDGLVTIADFALLGARFNTSLPPARAPFSASPVAPGAARSVVNQPFGTRVIDAVENRPVVEGVI